MYKLTNTDDAIEISILEYMKFIKVNFAFLHALVNLTKLPQVL